MKTTIKENGWDEIVTTRVRITAISKRPFMKVKKWIESNKRLNLHRKRTRCNCCKIPWEKLSGNVWLVSTDKNNKMICDKCKSKFENEI